MIAQGLEADDAAPSQLKIYAKRLTSDHWTKDECSSHEYAGLIRGRFRIGCFHRRRGRRILQEVAQPVRDQEAREGRPLTQSRRPKTCLFVPKPSARRDSSLHPHSRSAQKYLTLMPLSFQVGLDHVSENSMQRRWQHSTCWQVRVDAARRQECHSHIILPRRPSVLQKCQHSIRPHEELTDGKSGMMTRKPALRKCLTCGAYLRP